MTVLITIACYRVRTLKNSEYTSNYDHFCDNEYNNVNNENYAENIFDDFNDKENDDDDDGGDDEYGDDNDGDDVTRTWTLLWGRTYR